MGPIGRRGFVKAVGFGIGAMGVGGTGRSLATSTADALRSLGQDDISSPTPDPRPLYNVNLQTAIGLGDERASVVDGFGQIKSRHVWIRYETGSPLRSSAELKSSQQLEDGYLPIVHTKLRLPQGEFHSVAFSSESEDVKADYWGVDSVQPCGVTLWFPNFLSVTTANGMVVNQNQVLAVFPNAQKVRATQAKYNCLSLTDDIPPEIGERIFPHLDEAFSGNRHATAFIGTGSIRYRFPATNGQTHYAYLGVINADAARPGEIILDFYVDGQKQTVDVGLGGLGQPILKEFVAKPRCGSVDVRVECNPSSTNPYRPLFINGIWIFSAPVDSRRIITGELNGQALFYVPCGRESLADLASSIVLEFMPDENAQGKRWFKFPYETARTEAARLQAASPLAVLDATKQRWNSLLDKGASFVTSIPRLDNLYKTSLINLFLLRARDFRGSTSGEDIYVVKPGCTIYEGFWYRDGSYIVNAFDSAGYADEAEKSLRLFWRSDLDRTLKTLGQEPSGAWSRPIDEWDGQGQALWALVRHYQMTGDKDWLKEVYPAVRRGARWIREATAQTMIVGEGDVKPIYYGLLPVGEGEAIGHSYIYYHNFWAALGLRKALVASAALAEEQDRGWMQSCYEKFTANLRRSIRQAYPQSGENSYLPGDPFNPETRIWGALAALYPCEFLEPHDPMLTSTLERMERHSTEGLYTFVGEPNKDKKMWTYMTTDWAMCYMIRNDLPRFRRLFNGYVDHASPTNAWIEEIWIDSHIGTGDMPHGWAAADYVLLLRQALVWEMENKLHLCWGLDADWLSQEQGVAVKNAPTQFGIVSFQLKRSASSSLALSYDLQPHINQAKPEEVVLHIPPKLGTIIKSIEINGKLHPWSAGQTVISV
jgi:hypothetical protein